MTESVRVESISEENTIGQFINANNQLIINGLNIATESGRVFTEFMLKLWKFNTSLMAMVWVPYLVSVQDNIYHRAGEKAD